MCEQQPLAFSCGADWQQRFLAGVRAVHAAMGVPGEPRPLAALDAGFVQRVLQSLASGGYSPHSQFSSGTDQIHALAAKMPELRRDSIYTCIVLNARSARSDLISVENGGVLFEDPFWAVVAAYAVSGKPPLAIPRAKSAEEMWAGAGALYAGLLKRRDAEIPLARAVGFIGAPETAAFRLAGVRGEKLEALRNRGMQSFEIDGAVRFYDFFLPPAAPRK